MAPRRIGSIAFLAGLSLLSLVVCARPQASPSSLNARLFAAVEKGDVASAQSLLREGADVNAENRDGWTLMDLAAGRGDVKMARLLLDSGANVYARNSEDRTALDVAVVAQQAPVVELLLQKGIDRKTLNETLFEAIRGLPVVVVIGPAGKNASSSQAVPPNPVVTLLIDKGADINARDEEGASPLEDAAAYGQTSSAESLLEKNADIEARDNFGNTPLLAASYDNAVATMPDTIDTVNLLLEKGADINARNNDGDTALIIASGGGVVKTQIVKTLIEHGADLRVKNKKGETALMIAEEAQLPDVIQLLKAALQSKRQ